MRKLVEIAGWVIYVDVNGKRWQRGMIAFKGSGKDSESSGDETLYPRRWHLAAYRLGTVGPGGLLELAVHSLKRHLGASESDVCAGFRQGGHQVLAGSVCSVAPSPPSLLG